jgi:hypothetical protein
MTHSAGRGGEQSWTPPSEQPTQPQRHAAPGGRQWPWVLLAVLGVLVLVGAFFWTSAPSPSPVVAPVVTSAAAEPPPAPVPPSPAPVPPSVPDAPVAEDPPGDPATLPDGIYVVGRDIRAGMYRTSGADPGSPTPQCMWVTYRGDSVTSAPTGLGSATRPNQPLTVTVKEGTFRTDGCAPWVRTD